MVLASIFILILTISLILIFIGVINRDQALGSYMMIAGFLLMLLLSLLLLSDGVEYPSGEKNIHTYIYDENNTLINIETTTITEYEEKESVLSWVLNFVLLITGIAGVIGSALHYIETKKRNEENFYDE